MVCSKAKSWPAENYRLFLRGKDDVMNSTRSFHMGIIFLLGENGPSSHNHFQHLFPSCGFHQISHDNEDAVVELLKSNLGHTYLLLLMCGWWSVEFVSHLFSSLGESKFVALVNPWVLVQYISSQLWQIFTNSLAAVLFIERGVQGEQGLLLLECGQSLPKNRADSNWLISFFGVVLSIGSQLRHR